MLRKQIMIVFLIVIFSLTLSSCSSNPDNSLNTESSGMDNRIDNCMVRTNITYKNMESVFRDNNRKLFNIKMFYLDLRNKDIKHIPDCLSNDIELFVLGKAGAVPLAGQYNGKEAVISYLKAWYSSFSVLQMIFQFNLADEMDRNIINTHVQMIAKIPSSGKTINAEMVYCWKLNDEGKIKYLSVYYDTYSWWLAFQPKEAQYAEDLKGSMTFNIHKVNFDVRQVGEDTYTAFNTGAGSLPVLLGLLDNNFDFILKGSTSCIYPGKYHSKDGFMDFLNKLFTTISYGAPLYDEYFVVQGNRFDYHGIETVICNATGKMWSGNLIHSVIVTDEGKLLELKSYNDSFGMYEAFQPNR